MASRALIIAVENYPNARADLAQELPGSLDAALKFKAWVEEKWAAEGRAPAAKQMLFCSEPLQRGGRGASRIDLLDVFEQLKQDGQSTTEELFFFFSGHGFSFVEGADRRADVVIASDYVRAGVSGPCCFMLDEITSWLRAHLGPGRHYFFVDACRNPLTSREIQVGKQLAWEPQASGEASSFILQSTQEGAVAMVGGPFPNELLAGLRGKGKAKVWPDGLRDAMHVRYDSLRGHLKTKLTTQRIYNRVEGPDGESDGLLAVLRPVPISTCTVEIRNAPAQLSGEIGYKRGRSEAEQTAPVTGAQIKLPLEPDAYQVALRLQGSAVTPSGAVEADLYDDCVLVFQAGATRAVAGPTPAPLNGEVVLTVPAETVVKVRNVNSGELRVFDKSAQVVLPEGRYFAEASARDKHVFKREEFELLSGERKELSISDWSASPPHKAIAEHLPTGGGGVYFSESLGAAVLDSDLDLWLALLGGGRILGSTGDYSKIARFPLHNFSGERAGASPIYVLAGLSDPGAVLRVGVSHTDIVPWNPATEPPGMQGIREAYFATPPGPYLVSIAVGGGAPYTVASHASPNRATLVTVSLADDGAPHIGQYLLPIGHLIGQLDPDVRDRLQQRNHLRDVRFLANASRAFRRRRDVAKAMGRAELEDLLYAKWLDPIASSLAAYEYIRRGRKDLIGDVVHNMKRYFKDLPDTWALAKLAGEPAPRPYAPPLFFDGLRSSPDFGEWLPLAAGHLDFSSTWTAWRAAVKPLGSP